MRDKWGRFLFVTFSIYHLQKHSKCNTITIEIKNEEELKCQEKLPTK